MDKAPYVFQGERLRAIRKQRGWSQAEIRRRVQSDQSQYARYEKNRSALSIVMAARIAQELGVSLDWLLGLSDQLETACPLSEDELGLLRNFRDHDLTALLKIALREIDGCSMSR